MHPLALREPHLATHVLPAATPEPRHSLTTDAFCFVSSIELQYLNRDARTGQYQNREIPEPNDDRRARAAVHQSTAVHRRRPTIHLDDNPHPESGTGHRADRALEVWSSQPARVAWCPRLSGVVEHHPPDVGSITHVGISLIDLIQGVGRGDQLVELEVTPLEPGEEARNVSPWVRRTEE